MVKSRTFKSRQSSGFTTFRIFRFLDEVGLEEEGEGTVMGQQGVIGPGLWDATVEQYEYIVHHRQILETVRHQNARLNTKESICEYKIEDSIKYHEDVINIHKN